jgi:GNAT superfamily N-acetyltransferase
LPIRHAMSVSVRPAQPHDLEGLLQLLPQLSSRPSSDGARVPAPEQASRIFDQLLKRDGVTMLVAVTEQPEVVVGSLTLVVVPNLTYGGRFWAIVENVVVDAAHRRRGIGRRLVLRALELAEQEGCYKVQLLSGGKTEQVEFYRHLEFESSSCVGHKRYSGKVAGPLVVG